MVTLLDSSVLIAAERGKLDLEAILRSAGSDRFAVAAVTASAILHGVHRAATLEQRNRREALVESLLSRLPVLPFDLSSSLACTPACGPTSPRRVSTSARTIC